MADSKEKKNGTAFALRLGLVLTVLLACGLLLFGGRDQQADTAEQPVLPDAAELASETVEQAAEQAPVDLTTKSSGGQEIPAVTAPAEQITPIVYDQESYQLITDMIDAYSMQKPDRTAIIAEDAAKLKEHDPSLGQAWESIMDYWDYANTRMELNYNRLPEDLPQDDSLCIVVLGFQLQMDGSMSPEMHGRCELALRAAEQYPHAYVAVTGGGTAYRNPEATEAGVMAEWFLRKGISEERLILEDRSMTTEQNALFTREILTAQYPQIKSLVIVTSDYHMPLGCLMFTEAALLYACEREEEPFAVVSNLALQGYGIYEYKNPAEQAMYVRGLAKLQAPKP